MKKVIKFLKSIKVDKLLHFIAGYVIAHFTTAVISAVYQPSYKGCIAGLVLAVVAGMVKEIYDEFNKETQTPEFMDFIYTCLGGVLSSAISLIYLL